MNKSELLKLAHEKISNMSESELRTFLGIFKFTEPDETPLSEYSLSETVEISEYVPGIGFEFCGTTACIVGITYNGSSYEHILVKTLTRQEFKLRPKRIRKIK